MSLHPSRVASRLTRGVRCMFLKRLMFAVVFALPLSTTQAAENEVAAAVLPPLPIGLEALPIPEDNPQTSEKIELGKMLYFDKRLSNDGSVSCASCHDPKLGWANGDAVATGIRGLKGGRSAPTIIN